MAGRRVGQQTLAPGTPAVQADQVRLGPAFIDESKAGRIDAARAVAPQAA
jgi:hypothetical protein